MFALAKDCAAFASMILFVTSVSIVVLSL